MPKDGRRVFSVQQSAFGEYDLDGRLQDDISLPKVSYDRASGNGCYVMRMQPGATTTPRVRGGTEDFLMLEGEFVDEDGAVFKQGDFISYAPGTRHHSWKFPEPMRRANRGGRPVTKDWAGAAGFAAGYIVENVYPATQGEMVKLITSWFIDAVGDKPDDRQIERFVSELFKRGKT